MLNRTQTWLAAGILAVASIPAVSFARTHKPTQAAPSMSATTITPSTPIAATPASALTKVKHASKTSHKKLSSKHKAHTNLKHSGTHARKLSHSTKKHTKLHASKKKPAAA